MVINENDEIKAHLNARKIIIIIPPPSGLLQLIYMSSFAHTVGKKIRLKCITYCILTHGQNDVHCLSSNLSSRIIALACVFGAFNFRPKKEGKDESLSHFLILL